MCFYKGNLPKSLCSNQCWQNSKIIPIKFQLAFINTGACIEIFLPERYNKMSVPKPLLTPPYKNLTKLWLCLLTGTDSNWSLSLSYMMCLRSIRARFSTFHLPLTHEVFWCGWAKFPESVPFKGSKQTHSQQSSLVTFFSLIWELLQCPNMR